MSERDSDARTDEDVLQQALRRWEDEHTAPVPEFTAIRRRIAAAPSPMDKPRWTATRSLRLAGALVSAHVRIVPWLLIPVALLTGTVAVLAAWFFSVHRDPSAAVTGFSSFLLVGVTLTVTMALSSLESDAVSLATPLGPQIVVLTRVATVLVIDAAAGVVASVIVAGWGITGGIAAVLAGWMVPLATITGVVTLVAIWITPWAGGILGLVLMPLVGPGSMTATIIGLGSRTGILYEAITPVGVVALGAVLLTLAVASARRALTVNTTAV